MTALGVIRVGDLGTYIEIDFVDTNSADVNSPLDISHNVNKITIVDPDGNQNGPFTMTLVNTGTDGKAFYITSLVTSIWTKGGMWRWFGTADTGNRTVSTNDALREVLNKP